MVQIAHSPFTDRLMYIDHKIEKKVIWFTDLSNFISLPVNQAEDLRNTHWICQTFVKIMMKPEGSYGFDWTIQGLNK